MSTARFFFWLFAVASIGFGVYFIYPPLAPIAVGGIVLLQVLIGELHAIYRSTITVPKRK